MEYNNSIKELIYKSFLGILSADEEQHFKEWMNDNPENDDYVKELRKNLQIEKEGNIFYAIEEEKEWNKLALRLQKPKKPHLFKHIATIAASLLLPIGVMCYFFMTNHQNTPVQESNIQSNKNVVLVLANGETKSLEEAEECHIQINEDVNIKNANHVLRYDSIQHFNTQEVCIEYNTLKTSYGTDYQLVLSDGTKVWMNACSELKYPIHFTAGNRKVFLKGEAFFEVATDSSRIFQVITDDLSVQAYGTSFNVNTHQLSEVETVLVKGSIGVSTRSSSQEKMLKPGELVRYNKDGHFLSNPVQTNVYQHIAWKDGYIAFEEETLEEIMEMLKRWYNVEVIFKTDAVRFIKFTGCVERYEYIQKILDAIHEIADIHFILSGRTIYVS